MQTKNGLCQAEILDQLGSIPWVVFFATPLPFLRGPSGDSGNRKALVKLYLQNEKIYTRSMRYFALACDYDGTLATAGMVKPDCLRALQRLRDSGRKLILVTGRELDDLLKIFPEIAIFDQVVAENGALLFHPATRET